VVKITVISLQKLLIVKHKIAVATQQTDRRQVAVSPHMKTCRHTPLPFDHAHTRSKP
jgi:hypothetical protein